MINLTPIAKPIQERLKEKMRVLGRTKTKAGKSQTSKDGEQSPDGLTLRDVNTRSPFIRMTSAQSSPVMIMGGELSNDKEMMAGYQDIYGPRGENTNNLKRPIPGIKSIEVQFKGGIRALRTANIRWSCWTFDDVDRLRNHFLTAGRTVGLEWGWVYNRKDFNFLMSNYSLIDKDGKIKQEAFQDYRNKIFDAKGDFDFMVGVISNFEFTSRDDGGFDCTTTLASTGVNMFDLETTNKSSTNTMRLYGIKESDTRLEQIQKLKDVKVNNEKLKHIYYNSDLNLGIFLKNFPKWLKEKYSDQFQGDDRYVAGGFSTAESHYIPPAGGDASDTRVDEFNKEGLMFIAEKYFNEEEPNIWVHWGWFEDNILSKFVSFVANDSERGSNFVVNEFRSIEPVLKDGVATNVMESTKIRNHPAMTTTNYRKFILPGQFDTMSAAKMTKLFGTEEYPETQIQDVLLTGDDEVATKLKEVSDRFPSFAVPDSIGDTKEKTFKDKKYGYFRNILFNINFLREHFDFTSGTSIESGFKNLFDDMNDDIPFWDLNLTIDEVESNRMKITDMNTTYYDWEGKFKPLDVKTKYNKDGKVQPENLGVFHFPVWRSDSIVKRQSVTAKIPKAMQMAVMYGSNVDILSTFEGGDEVFSKVGVAAGALSKEAVLERLSKKNNDIYLNSIQLAYRNYTDYNLGTTNGDPSKPIYHGKGISLVGSWISNVGPMTSIVGDIEDKIQMLQDTKVSEDTEISSNYSGRLIAPELLPGGLPKFKEFLLTMMNDQNSTTVNEILSVYAKRYHANGKLKRSLVNGTAFLTAKYGTKRSDSLPILIPLVLELTLDGIGGIFPGNSFQSEYVPSRYIKETIFQAFEINHTVDSTGWTVTLSGPMRTTLAGLYSDFYNQDEQINVLLEEILSKPSIERIFHQSLPESPVDHLTPDGDIPGVVDGQIIFTLDETGGLEIVPEIDKDKIVIKQPFTSDELIVKTGRKFWDVAKQAWKYWILKK